MLFILELGDKNSLWVVWWFRDNGEGNLMMPIEHELMFTDQNQTWINYYSAYGRCTWCHLLKLLQVEGTFQHTSQGLQEGWVLCAAVQAMSQNNRGRSILDRKAQTSRSRGRTPTWAGELEASPHEHAASHHRHIQSGRESSLFQEVA